MDLPTTTTPVPDQLLKQECQSIKLEYDLTRQEYDCKDDQTSQIFLSNYSFNETTVLSHVKIEFDEIDKCHYESHIDVEETRWWNDRNPDDSAVKVRSFVCNSCKISFATKSQIINHLSESHECNLNVEHGEQKNAIEISHSASDEACEVTSIKTEIDETKTHCGIVIKKEEIQWQTEHRRQKPYKCAECDRAFRMMSSLRCHERIHTGEKPHECRICFEKFYRSDLLRMHEWTHTGQCPFKCSLCQRTFGGSKSLEIHQRVVHVKEVLFPCPVCDKRFTRKSNLVRHQTLHSANMGDVVMRHECDVCRKSFSAKADLKRHERVHAGEKFYQCDVCQKSFTQSYSLAIHRRLHTGETPYKCPNCPMGFSRRDTLRRHQLQRTCEEKSDSE